MRVAFFVVGISLLVLADFAHSADAPMPAPPGPAPLLLAPREVATAAQLKVCAAAVARRLAAHGYQGVSARVEAMAPDRALVRLDAASGFPDEMQRTIAELVHLRAKTSEIRYAKNLTGAAAEQWRPPVAPKGHTWILMRPAWQREASPFEGRDRFVLVCDSPVIRVSETTTATAENRPCFQLSAGAWARVASRKEPYDGTVLLIDDRAVDFGDIRVFDSGVAVWFSSTEEGRFRDLDAIIRNPMPVGLVPYVPSPTAPPPVAPVAPGESPTGIDK